MQAEGSLHLDRAVLVTLRHAGVRFGSVHALRGVSLTLHRGERLALVGANGSGKTSLLRLLHGLLVCSSGTAEYGARASGGPPAPVKCPSLPVRRRTYWPWR